MDITVCRLSQKTTGTVLKELEEGSDTLVRIGVALPKAETKVEIICFFGQLGASVGGIPIGKVRRP